MMKPISLLVYMLTLKINKFLIATAKGQSQNKTN